MPAILKDKLNENLNQSFKKSEKENYENNPIPTVKQVLSAKIEFEEIPKCTNPAYLGETKFIILKPNQPLWNAQHANLKTQQNTNEKNINGSSTSTLNKLPQPKKILFPKNKIQLGWNHNGQTRNLGSGCGFNNIGNTCYLNSALQAFFHVPALAQWLHSDREHRESSKSCKDYPCLICAMANTLLSTQRQSNGSFTPSQITNRLSQICKNLRLGHQEDAHEFLRYLIEKMEKCFLNRYRSEMWFKDLEQYSKETTPINQILGGYLRSTVTCLSCKHESVTFQHFQDLPLDISRVQTLDEAISGYFSRENLEECGYKCESCKKRVSASKKFSLERAPAVLCIQLKRFTPMGGKLSKPIAISDKLKLNKYLSNTSDSAQNCVYRMVSMVTHLGGSASGGHYTAVGMGQNGQFYNFDDCRVSPISQESALRVNAYVLFYELLQQTKAYESSMHNGHSIFHDNGHTYVKNGLENTTNGLSSSIAKCSISNNGNSYEKARANDSSFSRPLLPKIIPANIIKSQQLPAKNDSNKGFNGLNGNNTKYSTTFLNGNKKDESSQFEQDQKNDIGIKRQKIERSPLPSVPRLSDDNDLLKSPCKQSIPATTNIPSEKPRISLVPYDDDIDDDQSTICKTSSGNFIETDFKEKNKCPSKQGSTIVTKASESKSIEQNGKQLAISNGNGVHHADDPVALLQKLHHNGYGSQNVLSWNNKPSTMNREVVRDQQDDRKRHLELEEMDEMDRGRFKKIKYNNGQSSNSPNKGLLPNPFNDHQNMINSGQDNRYYGDRNNGYQRAYNNNNNNNNNNSNNKYDNIRRNQFSNNRNFQKNHNRHSNHNYPYRNQQNNYRR